MDLPHPAPTLRRVASTPAALFLLGLLLTVTHPATADDPEDLTFKGKHVEQVDKDKKSDISINLSGIAARGDTLVVGDDEGADLLILHRKEGASGYVEEETLCITLDGNACGSERKGTEVDIEGLAWGKKYLYVVGSHSIARKAIEEPKANASAEKIKKTEKKNRQRLGQVKVEPSRERIFRVELDTNGKLAAEDPVLYLSLRDLFANHPILSRFRAIPSKENGIDIEAIAVKSDHERDRLYLGFRGPVLRGNHALVMVLDLVKEEKSAFKVKKVSLKDPTVHYLNLAGRGIRGMTETSDGFLVLAGPVSDAATDDPTTRYPIYYWDGQDDDLLGKIRTPLCHAPESKSGGKAEGIALIEDKQTADAPYPVLVIYDSAETGEPKLFDCGA